MPRAKKTVKNGISEADVSTSSELDVSASRGRKRVAKRKVLTTSKNGTSEISLNEADISTSSEVELNVSRKRKRVAKKKVNTTPTKELKTPNKRRKVSIALDISNSPESDSTLHDEEEKMDISSPAIVASKYPQPRHHQSKGNKSNYGPRKSLRTYVPRKRFTPDTRIKNTSVESIEDGLTKSELPEKSFTEEKEIPDLSGKDSTEEKEVIELSDKDSTKQKVVTDYFKDAGSKVNAKKNRTDKTKGKLITGTSSHIEDGLEGTSKQHIESKDS